MGNVESNRSPGVGAVVAIAIAEASSAALQDLSSVEAISGIGLAGDRHAGNKARHVSIQSLTELDVAAERLGRPIDPARTRRNITLDVGELPRVRGLRLHLGGAVFEVFADAAPCDLMTELLGDGAKPALKRLAGIHCKVITGGTIELGDRLIIKVPSH